MSETQVELQQAINLLLKRRGKTQMQKPKGIGLPIAQTLAFRSIETRRIDLQVLVDSEWAGQLKMGLSDPNDKVSDAAFVAVERQAEILGNICLEALLTAIQGVHYEATVVIDVTGYDNP